MDIHVSQMIIFRRCIEKLIAVILFALKSSIVIAMAISGSYAHAQDQAKENKPIQMSLAEAVALNLRRNIDIKVAYMDRIQQKYDFVTDYYYAYQPRISADISEKRTQSDTKDNLTGLNTKTDTRIDTAGVMVNTKLPTGTQFLFSLPRWIDTKSTTDGAPVPADSSFRTTTWGVGFTQPLLKGAGIDYNTAGPKIAKLTEGKNKLNLKKTVSGQVKQVILDYRAFLKAKWNVEICKAALQRSIDLLEINRFQVELGTMASEDIIQSESDVAGIQLQLEDALNGYDNARINLLKTLDIPNDTMIEPVESLDTQPFNLDEARCLSLLFENQPTYLNSGMDLEIAEINAMIAKRNSLWDLSLSGSYDETDLRGGGPDIDGKQINKGIWLSLNVPLYGTDARTLKSAVLFAENNRKKAELNFRKLKDDTVLVVKDKVRNINILKKKIDMAVRASALEARKLENEREKLKAGRSSNFQLTAYQDQLKTANTNELAAKIDYLNALVDLDDYLGTTMDTWNIDVNDEKQGEGPLLKTAADRLKNNP
jgi:outer membrane protein TolC